MAHEITSPEKPDSIFPDDNEAAKLSPNKLSDRPETLSLSCYEI